jgi:molybdenum cofactor synthesis domain-containing protein
MIKILSVNTSQKKGTIKTPVDRIVIDKQGVKGDAHSGPWNRMVSMLGVESIRHFEKEAGRKISFGEFAENITTEGLLLYKTLPLDRFVIGGVELEVTQIGKSCHGDNCAIFREVGTCVMPKEGIFCRVLRSGEIKAGDEGEYLPRVFKCLVITLSDRASRGEYEDRSGPVIVDHLTRHFTDAERKFDIRREVIPDDEKQLSDLIKNAVADHDFIFTTGGTGIGPRDITPEVAKKFIDKEIPGIMEMIRVKYGLQKPNALLSRGIAGLAGNCFIFTLPGSVKGAEEYMTEIRKSLTHLVYMRYGIDTH